jgi:uncharacterized protein (TIGR02246 family)
MHKMGNARRVVERALVVMMGLTIGSNGLLANGQETAGKPKGDPHAADRAQIRAVMESFSKAFEAKDASGLANHWTVEGEYVHDSGTLLRGRTAIEKSFAEFFAKATDMAAKVSMEGLRFLSPESAVENGIVKIKHGTATVPTVAAYEALFVRSDGKWLIAQLRESPAEEIASIKDLYWLIGRWKSGSGQGAEIETEYSMLPSQKFLQVQFSVKEKQATYFGQQIIGVDPSDGLLHSWTFESDGGVGEAVWNKDGDHWVIDAAATLVDGRQLRESNILRRIDKDNFTFQSVQRTLDGAELADLPPVKVTRVAKANE